MRVLFQPQTSARVNICCSTAHVTEDVLVPLHAAPGEGAAPVAELAALAELRVALKLLNCGKRHSLLMRMLPAVRSTW